MAGIAAFIAHRRFERREKVAMPREHYAGPVDAGRIEEVGVGEVFPSILRSRVDISWGPRRFTT
jgi:hypothetical protein